MAVIDLIWWVAPEWSRHHERLAGLDWQDHHSRGAAPCRAGQPHGGHNPLFVPYPFTVNGKAEGTRTRLWASNQAGELVMNAELEGV
jgi:hypothetical protein